jgi:two-component system nitrate/nitrite response regulator NarL
MISMVLVDDSALSREALAAQLRSEDWTGDVHSAVDAHATVCLPLDPQPAVVLVSLASVDGLQILRAVRTAFPNTKVIAIAVSEHGDEALACARTGVAGIVLRSGTLRDLKATVAGVVRGETVCPPSVVGALVRHMADAADGHGPVDDGHLTSREREVLVFIEQGLTNKEIARRLGIEERTVKNHVHNLLEKFGFAAGAPFGGDVGIDLGDQSGLDLTVRRRPRLFKTANPAGRQQARPTDGRSPSHGRRSAAARPAPASEARRACAPSRRSRGRPSRCWGSTRWG